MLDVVVYEYSFDKTADHLLIAKIWRFDDVPHSGVATVLIEDFRGGKRSHHQFLLGTSYGVVDCLESHLGTETMDKVKWQANLMPVAW